MEYRVRISAQLPMTADILLVRVEAIEPAAFEVIPGAWMQWRIPGPENTLLRRCFSIACDAQVPGMLEFIIRKTPAGLGTKWLFEQAQVGDELVLAGPNGKFRLQDSGRSAVLIGGGSGLSALRSILQEMRDKKVAKPATTLFFGAVNKSQLYLQEELNEFTKTIPGFHFVPALSAPQPDDNWTGETGLITDVLDRHLSAMPDAAELEAYLCGSPGMLDACQAVLAKHGIPADRIYFDKFISPKQ